MDSIVFEKGQVSEGLLNDLALSHIEQESVSEETMAARLKSAEYYLEYTTPDEKKDIHSQYQDLCEKCFTVWSAIA